MTNLIRTATFCLFLLFSAVSAKAAESGMAQQLLAETNLARTTPQRYAEHLQELRRRFVGNAYQMPGTLAIVMTSEGVAALDEAIHFLKAQKPLAPLSWSEGLADSAADLVRDQGASGQIGHTGSRSGDMLQRIERHGSWISTVAENIGYGPDTARMMVMQLIIDDGVSDRGHRKNIFNPAFKVAGASCGAHAEFRRMCVMDFAGGFKQGKHK
jgi:uncharacterized protein YkwD